MTREKIEDIRFIVIPFVVNILKGINYEGQGDSDAKEFIDDFNVIFDLAIKALEQEPRWISVSERLPEKEEYVLCWLRYGDYMIAKWKYEEWTSEDKVIWVDGNPGTGTFAVIAWMPLPEPFKPQESEEE